MSRAGKPIMPPQKRSRQHTVYSPLCDTACDTLESPKTVDMTGLQGAFRSRNVTADVTKTGNQERDLAICKTWPRFLQKPPQNNKKPVISDWFSGADTRIRTGDLILTKDALYLLSYISMLPHRATDIYYHNSKKKARGNLQFSQKNLLRPNANRPSAEMEGGFAYLW